MFRLQYFAKFPVDILLVCPFLCLSTAYILSTIVLKNSRHFGKRCSLISHTFFCLARHEFIIGLKNLQVMSLSGEGEIFVLFRVH